MGEGRIEVPEARVMAICNFKKPATKKDLRSFLGNTEKIYPLLSDNSAHLTAATWQSAPQKLQWTQDSV